MSRKIKKTTGPSTEEKIKEAARKLFRQKGYAAVKTREIAAEAGINLALLNYYFRSKEKLFGIIMVESLRQFLQGMVLVFDGKEVTWDEKIDNLVNGYIDWLTQNPDLFFFILRELKSDPQKMETRLDALLPERTGLRKIIQKTMMLDKMSTAEIFHFMANVVGLIVTPFILKRAIQEVTNIDEKQFKELMEERKKLIPIWIRAIKKSK